MSWGYRVTILTLGFVSFMTFLVVGAFRQNFDLVTEDYYGKELKFQDQIEKQKNHQALEGSVSCTIEKGEILLRFPSDHSGKKIEGEVLFFRPSDASEDRRVEINVPENNLQVIDGGQFINGLYKVQVDYKVGDKAYYFEDAIMIQN